MLRVKNITKKYDKVIAVDNLSFDVKNGEIFGLLGLNGAGKTTTFRIIMGLIDDYDGEVTLDGKKIDYSQTDKIGFLTEERSLLGKMTVLEQMKLYGVLKGMTEEAVEKKLDEYLEKFNIPEYKNRKIKELSKGNQQKIQFISAIINDPKLLILDEPFTGLDPINVELFKKTIQDFKNKGTSIIFSSHRMDHVEEFCEKLAILVKGKAVIEGYLKDIKDSYKKKNIFISGKIKMSDLKSVKGVLTVEKTNQGEIKVGIADESVVSRVFKKIASSSSVSKFVVEDATLNEIFIDQVGKKYE